MKLRVAISKFLSSILGHLYTLMERMSELETTKFIMQSQPIIERNLASPALKWESILSANFLKCIASGMPTKIGTPKYFVGNVPLTKWYELTYRCTTFSAYELHKLKITFTIKNS